MVNAAQVIIDIAMAFSLYCKATLRQRSEGQCQAISRITSLRCTEFDIVNAIRTKLIVPDTIHLALAECILQLLIEILILGQMQKMPPTSVRDQIHAGVGVGILKKCIIPAVTERVVYRIHQTLHTYFHAHRIAALPFGKHRHQLYIKRPRLKSMGGIHIG